jgi:hypothetical protein
MNPLEGFGKLLIFFGIILIVSGLLMIIFSKLSGGVPGRMPGDIYIERDGFKFYFPVVSALLISLVLTVILNIIFFFINRK